MSRYMTKGYESQGLIVNLASPFLQKTSSCRDLESAR
jgi:hypothetical protein